MPGLVANLPGSTSMRALHTQEQAHLAVLPPKRTQKLATERM